MCCKKPTPGQQSFATSPLLQLSASSILLVLTAGVGTDKKTWGKPMRTLVTLFTMLLAMPAYAATYKYSLEFQGDSALELIAGFDSSDTCNAGEACYPDEYRLPGGFFEHIQPGDQVTAFIDTDAGTGEIAGWTVAGDFWEQTSGEFAFISSVPTGQTTFGTDTVKVLSEGPRGYSPSGICNPERPLTGMPDGYCGFFGYQAEFAVLDVASVPLPASGLLLIGGLVLLRSGRRRTL